MDRLPIPPDNNKTHDVISLVIAEWQDAFIDKNVPKNIIENIQKYIDNSQNDDIPLNDIVQKVVQERCEYEEAKEEIRSIEKEMMTQHALHLIQFNKFEKNVMMREIVKSKRLEIFGNLSVAAVEKYNLIQKEDLLPNRVERFLNFQFNPELHTCKSHAVSANESLKSSESCSTIIEPSPPTEPAIPKKCVVIVAEPSMVKFQNCEIGQLYKRKFKLRNITNKIQPFKRCLFLDNRSIKIEQTTQKMMLASGMTAEFLITYEHELACEKEYKLLFKTRGEDVYVTIRIGRDAPLFICYIFNTICEKLKNPLPDGWRFSRKRNAALNFTIDCGTCLLGNYILTTMLVKNVGGKGKFFITTENEWAYCNFNDESNDCRFLEITKDCFSIYPTYFEVGAGEISTIFISFIPEYEGFYTETFYCICDNNSFESLEVVADCISFSGKTLEIYLFLEEHSQFTNEQQLVINLEPGMETAFVISVQNNSSINLDYHWELMHEENEYKKLDPNWFRIEHTGGAQFLTFSESDFLMRIKPNNKTKATYSIILNLYIDNVPIYSLPQDVMENIGLDVKNQEECCQKLPDSSRRKLNICRETKSVHICSLVIICQIGELKEKEKLEQQDETSKVYCTTNDFLITEKSLNFGVIPLGVIVARNLTLTCLQSKPTKWKFIEVRYLKEKGFIQLTNLEHLSKSAGICGEKNKKFNIKYTVEAKEVGSWISILFLYTLPRVCTKDPNLVATCVIVYEVTEIDVNICTEDCKNAPIICPREVLYKNIPHSTKVFLKNVGISTAIFDFLSPCGEDVTKVDINVTPQRGVIKAGEHRTVEVTYMWSETGVYEEVYLPCFTGNLQNLLAVKIICAVEDISVIFYLPSHETCFCNIRWPCPCDSSLQEAMMPEDGQMVGEDQLYQSNIPTEPGCIKHLADVAGFNSIAHTYPTVKLFKLSVKQTLTMKFYIENITPLRGNYTVRPLNFLPQRDEKLDQLTRTGVLSRVQFWEQSCLESDGIIVEPTSPGGVLEPNQRVEILLNIYSNTWGFYLEEVVVEIDDLTPFCFNLLIEVIGAPVQFPLALNTIMEKPTYYFGFIVCDGDTVTKTLRAINISSVPIFICWHIYEWKSEQKWFPFNLVFDVLDEEFLNEKFNLFLTNEYVGAECQAIEVDPFESYLEPQEQQSIKIIMNPKLFEKCTHGKNLKFILKGYFYTKDELKYKENYFRRKVAGDTPPTHLTIHAILQKGDLQIEPSDEGNDFHIFVNNILLKKIDYYYKTFIISNNCECTLKFTVDIEKPFFITKLKTRCIHEKNETIYLIKGQRSLKIEIGFYLSVEEIMQFAEFLYKSKGSKDYIEKKNDYVCSITKTLNVTQLESFKKDILVTAHLYFPQIKVTPKILKFSNVCLYCTSKQYLEIYNLTGAPVQIELYKSSNTTEFTISPSCFTIPPTIGSNPEFVVVFVYFTPRECRGYKETLRITTNIPHYFIDVSICGYGTNNERFYNV